MAVGTRILALRGGVAFLLALSLVAGVYLVIRDQLFGAQRWLPLKMYGPLNRPQTASPADPNSSTHPATPSHSAPSTISKSIVMAARVRDDTAWVEKELPGWDRAIYVVDADEANIEVVNKVPQNKGREGNAYLWHIIQHYDNLTDVLVFMHPHRQGAWHVDNEEQSNPLLVQRLELGTVLREGFVNLRCEAGPTCPDGLRLPWDMKADEIPSETTIEELFPAALRIMFPTGIKTPDATVVVEAKEGTVLYPDLVAAPCCAQFAVAREQVLQRPRSDYERYHRWLMDAPLIDLSSGRVMEYLWHIIFGRPAYWCPDPAQCYCELYKQNCTRTKE